MSALSGQRVGTVDQGRLPTLTCDVSKHIPVRLPLQTDFSENQRDDEIG